MHDLCAPVEYVPVAHAVTVATVVDGQNMPAGQAVHCDCPPVEK